MIAQNQQVMRLDEEHVVAAAPALQESLLGTVQDILGSVDVLLISDYNKGVFLDGMARRIIELARQTGITTLVDPKSRDFSVYQGANIVTPNLKELEEATGMPVHNDDAIVAACHQLIASCDFDGVVATRSQAGMSVVTPTKVAHIPAHRCEVYDVSGAGDTVIATLAAGLAVNLTLEDAARLASIASGIVVGKLGTAQVTVEELRSIVCHQQHQCDKNKIAYIDHAINVVDHWRRDRLKIGLVYGRFDILLAGHIAVLGQARKSCDKLIVGIISDKSIGTLNGGNVPFQNEIARATVLAALADVDLVVRFHEDAEQHLINNIKPDVLVKNELL